MKFEAGARVGPYQILGELGQGGMATVYRAYQPNLEREVALKILPEFLLEEPGFKTRFHREAVAVARLQHPNILSIFDHGEQDGVTYIVSEYVEGGTLAARLGAPIQLDYCVRMLRPIADALDYAHDEGIVHRDVKPSNILLDRRGVPILSDFGLARMVETRDSGRLTQTGATVGTPTYMAPEQCAGDEVGPPADIYALAVIAYEMITGRVPFSAPTPLGVMSAHQLKPPPSPRKLNPSLPVVVEAPMLAGLAKNPADRPATATDFVDALAEAISSSSLHMPLTPAPMYPLSPPPPSQVPAPAEPSPPPPSVSWPSSPAPPPIAPTPSPITPAPPTVGPPSPPSPIPPPQPLYQAQPAPYSPPAGYTPTAAYPPPQPAWDARTARPGVATWVIVVLAVGAGLAGVVFLLSILVNLFSTDLTSTDRWTWLVLAVLSGLATSIAIGALIGLVGRDRWGPAMGWAAVAALGLTLCGIPLAAAAGWGMVQAHRGQVRQEPKPGGGLRLGSSALVIVAMLAVSGSTAAWGWTHPARTAVVAPRPSPSPTACGIAQPDSPISAGAAGGLCGFKLGDRVVALDCKDMTSLPSEIEALSVDGKGTAGSGGATFGIDGGRCHFAVPSYYVDSRLQSVSDLSAGNTLFLADVVPSPTGTITAGFLFGCDGTSCLYAYLSLPDDTVEIDDGTTLLVSQHVTPQAGTNRLMVTIRQQQLSLWFNGTLVATEAASRPHGGGKFALFVESLDKSNPIAMDVLQFAVFRVV